MTNPILVELHTGAKMPAIGYGTWKVNGDDVEVALEAALEVGYRHIDTALVYENEHVIGKVLRKWLDSGKIKREDLFIVTKAMEAQVDAGLAKAIGISNFNERQIQRILDCARIKPASLQVELHAYHQQKPLVEFCKNNNITVVAYSPLGRSGSNKLVEALGGTQSLPDLLHNETALRIGNKYKKTAAQVLLRHILQRGLAAIPKSINADRIRSNFQIFDFELDESDMEALDKLDHGGKVRLFDFLSSEVGDHPEYPF